MELRLAVLFGLYCIQLFQTVEGSGLPGVEKRKLAVGDNEIVASGLSPDDEDGDVDDGSGSPNDELEGSGGGIIKSNITLVTSPPLHYTTTTKVATEIVHVASKKPTEKLPPKRPVEETDDKDDRSHMIHESDRPGSRPDEDHNVLIEDLSTSRTAPPFKPSTAVHTTITTPPTGAGDENRVYLGALFKPGILAAVIGGFVVGILAAILLVMFIVYRMRKKDEGSYALDEQKQPPIYPYAYQKAPTKEFYA